jgi:hypothetical protein
MLKRPAVHAAKSSYHASMGVWRGLDTLHLTMVGEANEDAVRALIMRCRQMIVGDHLVATIVLIDTLGVTGLAVGPGFMGACRELLTLLRSRGTILIVGVSDNTAVRSVASAVGFGVGIRLRIAKTLVEGLALADGEAAASIHQ